MWSGPPRREALALGLTPTTAMTHIAIQERLAGKVSTGCNESLMSNIAGNSQVISRAGWAARERYTSRWTPERPSPIDVRHDADNGAGSVAEDSRLPPVRFDNQTNVPPDTEDTEHLVKVGFLFRRPKAAVYQEFT
jgi:hypothetical protein